MKIGQLTDYLEDLAPLSYQESYDNAGLIVGDRNQECTGVLICLDSIEAVVAEAVEKNCNLIIAHHPIIFRGLKRLTGSRYVQRTVIEAIRQGIAIYAVHTNLDNVLAKGVNQKIGQRLGLKEVRVLQPRFGLTGFSLFIDGQEPEKVLSELDGLGATHLNTHAKGDGAILVTGQMERGILPLVKKRLPACSVTLGSAGTNAPPVGSGLIGLLPEAMEEIPFLHWMGQRMKTRCIRHTALLGRPIRKVALCGGAGGFLLPRAIAEGADVFLTADYKYHEFFDADGKILLADLGHFESEQFTIDLLFEVLSSKFPNFAFYSTEVNTNPVHYLYPEAR